MERCNAASQNDPGCFSPLFGFSVTQCPHRHQGKHTVELSRPLASTNPKAKSVDLWLKTILHIVWSRETEEVEKPISKRRLEQRAGFSASTLVHPPAPALIIVNALLTVFPRSVTIKVCVSSMMELVTHGNLSP